MDIMIERKEGIAEVKFNRPEVRNPLTFEMNEGVYNLCVDANETEELRAIIFAGVDSSAFASGTDISLLQGIKDGKGGIEYEERIERVGGMGERCRGPTISALAGGCAGGGWALVTRC